jgi:hypothetical protein
MAGNLFRAANAIIRSRGNAFSANHLPRIASVHPRACGERMACGSITKVTYGSSPRVRGTQLRRVNALGTVRFIPARAGNVNPEWLQPIRGAVHPRACGERLSKIEPLPSPSGSSPRVRGTPGGLCTIVVHHRFIPVRAGNATAVIAQRLFQPVHPRACGERPVGNPATEDFFGSSPRVRGTRWEPRALWCRDRFIPAEW